MNHSKSGMYYEEQRSQMTQSTNASSMGDCHSQYSDDLDSFDGGFDSPAHHMCRKQSHMVVSKGLEGGWKKKVKTELCRFWLMGQEC